MTFARQGNEAKSIKFNPCRRLYYFGCKLHRERRGQEEINYVTNLFSSQLLKPRLSQVEVLPTLVSPVLLPLVPFNIIGLISHNVSPSLNRLKRKLFTSCLSLVESENSILKRRKVHRRRRFPL